LRLRSPGRKHLFLGKNNIFLQMQLHYFFVVFLLTKMPAHISLALNYIPNKILF